MNRFLIVCLWLVLAATGFISVSAQGSLRKAVYGESSASEKKVAVRKKPDSKAPTKTSSSAKNGNGSSTRKKAPNNTARRQAKPPGWISVTFTSKEPNTQI